MTLSTCATASSSSTTPRDGGKLSSSACSSTSSPWHLTRREGRLLPVTTSAAYRLFVEGETPKGGRLEPRLSISTRHNTIDDHLGRHPVIYLDLNEAVGADFAEVFTYTAVCLSKAFDRHSYLEAN